MRGNYKAVTEKTVASKIPISVFPDFERNSWDTDRHNLRLRVLLLRLAELFSDPKSIMLELRQHSHKCTVLSVEKSVCSHGEFVPLNFRVSLAIFYEGVCK